MTDGALEVEVLAPDGTVVRSSGAGGFGRGARIAAVALAVLAVLGTVAFAVSRATAPSGPQSPEAAVDELFAALAAGDVVAVLDVLRPAEREALGEPVPELVAELQRLDVLADDLDLSAVPGLSLVFDDLEYVVEDVTDDLAVVTTTDGTVTRSVEVAALPLGAAVRDRIDGLPLPDDVIESTTDVGETGLAVVREDGAWYVSLWYSVAEDARREAGAELPAEHAIEPVGAETPEGVVTGLLDAVAALDPRAALALLDPEEAAPVYDYSALFVPAMDAALAGVRDRLDLEVTITGMDFDVERDGARATVVAGDPDAVSIVATWDDPATGPASLSYDGGCLSIVQGGAPAVELCPGSETGADLLPVPGIAESIGGLGDAATAVATVERDGRWYLSPGSTVVGSLVDSLAALEPSDLEALLSGLDLLASLPLDIGAGLDAGLGAGLDDSAAGSDEPPLLDSVALDDPRVEAIIAGLPAGLAQVAGDGLFDNAYAQRSDGVSQLTVTRVLQLDAGFADITVSEATAVPSGAETIDVDGHAASVERFGDGVVVTGLGGGYGVQVSVFGLDRGIDPEAAALELYAATIGHLTGL